MMRCLIVLAAVLLPVAAQTPDPSNLIQEISTGISVNTVAWIPWPEFGGVPQAQKGAEKLLPFEVRLLDDLRREAPGLTVLGIEERSRKRYSGSGETVVQVERGLALAGPDAQVEKARSIVAGYLAALESTLVSISCTIVSIGDETIADGEEMLVLARPQAVRERLEMLAQRKGGEVIVAPRLVTRNGQPASVRILNQHSYVQDFKVEMIQNAAIADPVVGVVEDGILLDLTVFSRSGGNAAVDGLIQMKTLVQPIEEIRTDLGFGGSKVSIQRPELRTSGYEIADLELTLEDREACFGVRGLVLPSADRDSTGKNVEVWFHLRLEPSADQGVGSVLAVDSVNRAAFVTWPAALVGDDPARLAPKKVLFTREGQRIATGTQAGGWYIGGLSEERWRRVAVYHWEGGEVLVGDGVAPASDR